MYRAKDEILHAWICKVWLQGPWVSVVFGKWAYGGLGSSLGSTSPLQHGMDLAFQNNWRHDLLMFERLFPKAPVLGNVGNIKWQGWACSGVTVLWVGSDILIWLMILDSSQLGVTVRFSGSCHIYLNALFQIWSVGNVQKDSVVFSMKAI